MKPRAVVFVIVSLLGSTAAAPKPTLKVTLDKIKVVATRAWLITPSNGNQRLTISLEDPATASVDVCNKAKPGTPPKPSRYPAYQSIMFTLGTSAADRLDLAKLWPIGVSYMKTEKAHIAAPTETAEGTLEWLPAKLPAGIRRVRVKGKAAARRMVANDGSITLDAPAISFDGEIDVVVCQNTH